MHYILHDYIRSINDSQTNYTCIEFKLEKMLNRRNYHDFYDELFTHVQKAFKVDFGINYFKN